MQETAPAKSTRPPPIVLTSAANLIQLQRQMKGVAKQSFELRNARNGTRVLTKDIKDFQAVKAHFDQNNLCYFTFFPKSEKPLKAVIRHLPSNTPAEDIAEALLCLGYDDINEILLAAVYTSPGRAWSDVDITELLSFRKKCTLAGDLNAKHPFWNRSFKPIRRETSEFV
jgi:hypothetical protein